MAGQLIGNHTMWGELSQHRHDVKWSWKYLNITKSIARKVSVAMEHQ